ncbi:MAG: DUF6090 family protein [Saprospiraceae bacterium]|nr:DUF6090 family protein [Saprospiraceae bacterium]
MRRLFANIRKSLLGSGRARKYLVYAIGEIALVVIGILIALQINNWNEARKNRILEQEYYCRLLDDVTQDGEQLLQLTALAEARLRAANNALRLLHKASPRKLDVGREIGQAIRAIYADFTPNDAAFEDLKSGANLNIMRDKSVIKALNQYYNQVDRYLSIIRINAEHAVAIYFAHADKFANGWVHANALNEGGRLHMGMEPDVLQTLAITDEDLMTADMRSRLVNEALDYLSTSARHLELYGFIQTEIDQLTGILAKKCPDQEQ